MDSVNTESNRTSDRTQNRSNENVQNINFDFLSASRDAQSGSSNLKAVSTDRSAGTAGSEFLEMPPLAGFQVARSERVLHSLLSDQNPVDSLLPDKNIDTNALVDSIRKHGKIRLIVDDNWDPKIRHYGVPGTTHGDNTLRAEYESLPELLKKRIELVPVDQSVYGINGAAAKINEMTKDGIPSVISIANDRELTRDEVNHLLKQNLSSLSELSDAKRSQLATRLLQMPDIPASQELKSLQEVASRNNPVIVASGNDKIQLSALVQNAIVTQSQDRNAIKLPFADALAQGENTSQSTRSTVRLTLIGLLKSAFPEEGRDASPMGRHPD